MNIGKFCPLPLGTLLRTFRIYSHIVSLAVVLRNWVCENWVSRDSNQDPLANRIARTELRDLKKNQTCQNIVKTSQRIKRNLVGHTPKGAYSSRGRSRHLLETAFSEPLLRTLLRTLFYCKTHRRPPSQNPSENHFPRTLPRTFSEPFSERCVAVRPLRRAPYFS